jgi:hypothetical protein
MSTEELGYILKMPVPCPHCLQESEQTVAFLIDNEISAVRNAAVWSILQVVSGLRFGKSSQKPSQRSSPITTRCRNDPLQRQTKREGC